MWSVVLSASLQVKAVEEYFNQQVTSTRKIEGSIGILYNTFVNEQKFFASGILVYQAGTFHFLLGYHVHNRCAKKNDPTNTVDIYKAC